MAIIQRERAISTYLENPNHCLFCGLIILIPPNAKVNEIRRKKFCNRSCAAKYTNRNRIPLFLTQNKEGNCQNCGKSIIYNKCLSGKGYFPRRYCNTCCLIKRLRGRQMVQFATKGELLEKSKNWQSARSMLRRHAQRNYLLSDKAKVCQICGYDKYIEICHIKSVKFFSNDTPLSTINHLDNLIALCPNHHWEHDHLS